MSSYISGIRYELGDCVPITAEALQCSEELVEAFRADGQTTFRRSEDVGSQLAAVPARASLEAMERKLRQDIADHDDPGGHDRRVLQRRHFEAVGRGPSTFDDEEGTT